MATPRVRTRVERDTLGTLRVPARALYGAQTARALSNFSISGLTAHPSLVEATVQIKIAAARANARLGLLSRRKARAIEAAAREVCERYGYREILGYYFPGTLLSPLEVAAR